MLRPYSRESRSLQNSEELKETKDTQDDWGHFYDPDQSDDEQEIGKFKDQYYLESQKDINLCKHDKLENPALDITCEQINYNPCWNDAIRLLSVTSFLIVILAIMKNKELSNFLSGEKITDSLGQETDSSIILF